MENTHSTFLVLRISEDKDNGNADIDVLETFITMTDARNYKDAKDSIDLLSPIISWRHTQYKIQQGFYKSFVQEAKAS